MEDHLELCWYWFKYLGVGVEGEGETATKMNWENTKNWRNPG